MRRWLLLTLILLLAVATQAQVIKKMGVQELNNYISQSEKPLVVSFWATWCTSCNEEIPYFISTIKEKYDGQVELLLVSLDIRAYYPAKIASFVAKKKYDASLAWLSEPNADVFCPAIDPGWSGAIPSTLMVNNKRRYRKFYEVGMSPLQFERNLKLLLFD